MSNNVVTLKSV